MNVVEIYEQCKSSEFITLFNGSGLCISYACMKKHRNDIAKFAIPGSSEFDLLIPSTFTISVFDHFDHVENNTLSGK